ncbi:MAG: hypothetical protein HYZ47_05840 [Simkania negevensis]|nr:hypothetical protein [Simkania negevensis]
MNEQLENAPLLDAIDLEILMHREVHFGSNFHVMLQYYKEEGVGALQDFSLQEIKKLEKLEKDLGKDLAETYLPETAKEIVKEKQKLYQKLRDVYSEKTNAPYAMLLSDLILSEEEFPKKEIESLIKEGKNAVSALIFLLSSNLFYDPLSPGYGRSPLFAAQILAKIQDGRAIAPLFEALGQESFFADDELIKALCSFGEKSKKFLLNILKQRPFSKDNEHAAIVLSFFPQDPEIEAECLTVLEQEETLRSPLFFTYLLSICTSLSKEADRKRLISISHKKNLPKEIASELELCKLSF